MRCAVKQPVNAEWLASVTYLVVCGARGRDEKEPCMWHAMVMTYDHLLVYLSAYYATSLTIIHS